MLGSFCVSASIHSQMRLNTQPRTAGHKHTHTLTIIIIPKCHSYSVMGQIRWFGLYSLLSLCSRLCFLLYLRFSLVCSISLCHDESGRGSDRHSAVTRLLPEISVSFLPRSSALLTSLPPPLYPLSSATAASNPFKENAKSWPESNVGQGQVRRHLCAWVYFGRWCELVSLT